MAAKRRDVRPIKKVPGVERAVAVEIVSGSVKVIGPRLGNGVDYATGAPAVLGGVIVGENRELADRIHSHVHVQGASRTGVGIIIDHQSVDPKNVFNDAAAGNGDGQTIAALGTGSIGLSFARILQGSRLQQRQLEPVAAVQRELADGGRIHEAAQRGAERIHLGRFARDLDLLGDRSDGQ